MTDQNIQNSQDNDFKYVMLDTGNIYLCAKYTFGDLMEHEMVPFEFTAILERYIIPEIGADTTLESHFYYMQPGDFAYKTFLQLKAKVKISRPVIKRKLFGRKEHVFITENISLQEFAKMSPQQKEQQNIFIQEIVISKLGMITFVV